MTANSIIGMMNSHPCVGHTPQLPSLAEPSHCMFIHRLISLALPHILGLTRPLLTPMSNAELWVGGGAPLPEL